MFMLWSVHKIQYVHYKITILAVKSVDINLLVKRLIFQIVSSTFFLCFYNPLRVSFSRAPPMLRNLHKNTGLYLRSLLLYKEFIWKYSITAQDTKFTIKEIFSKCKQFHSFLQICSNILKKSVA